METKVSSQPFGGENFYSFRCDCSARKEQGHGEGEAQDGECDLSNDHFPDLDDDILAMLVRVEADYRGEFRAHHFVY